MADRLPWFRCYPDKLLGALAAMTPDQQLIYVILLLRIYEVRGPCPDSLDALARRVGINRRRISDALDALFRAGKLTRESTGIANPFANGELSEEHERHQQLQRAGQRGGSARAEKAKSNQRKHPSPAKAMLKQEDLEEDSLFSNENRAQAGSPADPEKQLFDRGKELLGQAAGGLIAKLLVAKGKDVALARAAIETASTKQNPREYIGGVIRSAGAQPTARGERKGNPFVGIHKELRERESHDDSALFVSDDSPASGRPLARLTHR